MLFKTVEIEGLKIFYREAGKPGSPKLVLLAARHSSRRFENRTIGEGILSGRLQRSGCNCQGHQEISGKRRLGLFQLQPP